MPDEINIGGKKLPKKPVLIAAGITVVAGGAYYIRKKKAAAATAAVDPSAATTDTTGQIDPATGFAYGSAEDSAALAQFSTSGLPVNVDNGGGGTTIPPTTTTGFATNPQWAQAYEQLTGSNGHDAIAAAIGKYLTGQPMTTAQQQTATQAIGAQGYPPVAGADGFPPSFRTVSNPPPVQGGKKTVTTVQADGHDTLRDIAAKHPPTTYPEAQKLNPWAHKYTVKTASIPKGSHVKVYQESK